MPIPLNGFKELTNSFQMQIFLWHFQYNFHLSHIPL